MDQIKAVLIDVDNTLLSFDGYVKQSMKDGFQKYHLGEYTDEKYELFELINGALWHQIELKTLDFETLKRIRWNMVFHVLGIEFDGIEFEEYFRTSLFNSAIHMPEAMDLLQYLSAKYPLYVASNGPYEQQLNRMKIAGMDQYFSGYMISEEIGFAKPSREFFTKGFSRLHEIHPEEAVIVGDSLTSDMKGGIDFGMHTIWFNPDQKVNRTTIQPEYTIRQLSEIKSIL